VYVGGAFTQVNASSGTVPRNNAAAVDLSTGLDTGWDPNPTGGPVDALAISGSTVYMGGSFTAISGGVFTTSPRLFAGNSSVARLHAAAVSAATGTDTGWNPAPDGAVKALAISGATVYLGGRFTQVNSSALTTVTRSGAAGVDSLTGYDTGWNAGLAPDDTVNSLATYQSDVYLGGAFGVASTTGAQHLLTVSEPGTGGGNVTSSPAAIGCPGVTCSSNFDHGTKVTLTEAPVLPGSGFAGWSGGGCAGTATTCTVMLDADTTVTAIFNPTSKLTVQTAGAGAGTVTSSPSGINCAQPPGGPCPFLFTDGTQVTLTASPAGGSSFAGWAGGPCFGDVTTTCTFTMSPTVGTVFATFNVTHNLTVGRIGNGSGSVTSNPVGINCPATSCSQPFDDGTDVVLTATPYPGSRFAGWSGGCTGSGPCELTLGQDTTVTATFVRQHMLTVGHNGSGSGTVSGGLGAINCGSSCGHVYDQGMNMVLTASPATGSTFTGWTGGGCAGSVSSCTVILSFDTQVTATFTARGTKPPPPPPPPPPKKKPAPKCTLKGGSSRVLLAAPRKGKGKPKVKPGTLAATVHCDRATTVTVSAVITEVVGKKPKHGKQRTKTFRIGPVRASMAGERVKDPDLLPPPLGFGRPQAQGPHVPGHDPHGHRRQRSRHGQDGPPLRLLDPASQPPTAHRRRVRIASCACT
jgi:hypothetical protein